MMLLCSHLPLVACRGMSNVCGCGGGDEWVVLVLVLILPIQCCVWASPGWGLCCLSVGCVKVGMGGGGWCLVSEWVCR